MDDDDYERVRKDVALRVKRWADMYAGRYDEEPTQEMLAQYARMMRYAIFKAQIEMLATMEKEVMLLCCSVGQVSDQAQAVLSQCEDKIEEIAKSLRRSLHSSCVCDSNPSTVNYLEIPMKPFRSFARAASRGGLAARPDRTLHRSWPGHRFGCRGADPGQRVQGANPEARAAARHVHVAHVPQLLKQRAVPVVSSCWLNES